LIAIIDAQKASIERIGPTEDCVRLQLILSQAEVSYDFEAARKRLTEVYLFVAGLSDLVLKATSLALIVGSITMIDPDNRLEKTDGLHTLVDQDLSATISDLLSSTADHQFAVRKVIGALAQWRPDAALKVTRALNTEYNRDDALLELVDDLLSHRLSEIHFDALFQGISEFADRDYRDIANDKIWHRIGMARNEKVLQAIAGKLVPLASEISSITSSQLRCRAACNSAATFKRSNKTEHLGLANSLEETAEEAWKQLENEIEKIDLGFEAVSILAPYFRDKATKLLAVC
jgi:hypothetical protein